MVQVGIFAVGLVKKAIVEMRLASEVRNALTWTIVVVRHRKYFLVTGLEFRHGHHGSILAQKFAVIVETKAFTLRIGSRVIWRFFANHTTMLGTVISWSGRTRFRPTRISPDVVHRGHSHPAAKSNIKISRPVDSVLRTLLVKHESA